MNESSLKFLPFLSTLVRVLTNRLVALGLLLFVTTTLHAQPQRYPANVTPTLGLPYSLFISDYTDPGQQQLVANILFNDFNEPEWTFKLKLRIENMDILLETLPGFTPSQPITVSPGQPFRFAGSDWIEYFDYSNLNITGPGRETLLRSGRLPEGGYTLYLQVLDYETGEPLSPETPVSWWMGLYNPPMLVLPEADSYINPSATQIPFTWQLFNAAPGNLMGTEYQLSLWEVTEENQSLQTVDPYSVIQNGQALQVYQSDIAITPNLVYGPAEPALEPGKAYIYRVQALDPEGKDSFKNGGHSEYRRFYYGWPLNGKISLTFPEAGHTMSRHEQSRVRWSAPDNKLPLQPVQYELRIAEKSEDKSAAEALAGPLWYHYESSASASGDSFGHPVPETASTQQYAWEVIAYSDGQEVARSPQQVFSGPPLMDRFFAGVHRVEVRSISNNPDDLSGSGKVRLTPGEEWTDITFERLKIRQSGSIWNLEEGEILIDGNLEVELTPGNEINGPADFVSDSYRLTKEGLWIHGHVEWALHLATTAEERAMIVSKNKWLHFNEFSVVGSLPLAEGNRFDLLDPFGFQLSLDTTSRMLINENTYRPDLNGFVGLPTKVISADHQGKRVSVPFMGEAQLQYFTAEDLPALSPLYVSETVNIFLESSGYTVDLSDHKSPTGYTDNPAWKGLAYDRYSLTIPANFDPKGRLKLSAEIKQDFVYQGSGLPAHITGEGIDLKADILLGEEQQLTFNTFPAKPDRFYLEITDSEISGKSSLGGNILIPILSKTDPFDFHVPMTSQGFMSGYFDGIEGYAFVHNAGNEEQQLNVTVRRAVIEEDERLSLTLDLEWPALDVKMEGVRYFKVWGNYNIGFYTPEGIFALDRQLNTTWRGYPVTVDAIAAGRSSGRYGFGVSGKINLGDDVSGDDGAPSFNLYSLVENELLPGDYVPDPKATSSQVASFNREAEKQAIEAGIEEEKENLVATLDAGAKQIEGEIDAEISTLTGQWAGGELAAEEMLNVPEKDTLNGIESRIALELLPEILNQAVELLPEESPGAKFSRRVLSMNDGDQENMFQSMKDLPQEFASELAQEFVTNALKPLESEVGKISDRVNGEVDRLTVSVNQEVEVLVSSLVDNAAQEVVNLLADQSPEVATIIAGIAVTVKQEIIFEVQTSINQSVYDNITFPVASLLQDQVLGRVETHLLKLAQDATIASFTRGTSPGNVIEGSLAGLDDELAKAGEDVLAFLNPESLLERIRSLGSDAINGISGERIMGRIKAGAINVITTYAADKVAGAFNELANQALGEELGVEIPIDIGGAVTKLISGGGVKAILSDPIPVKVRSPAVDFNGLIHFMQGHPIYGDGFSGLIEARIKVPDDKRPIEVSAAYMNGRTENTPYWYVEVGGGASQVQQKQADNFEAPEGMDQVGGEMSEEMAEPANGIKLGVAQVMALRARVYKHMKPGSTPLGEMVPDASNEFGAYLHMVLYGPKNGDRLRLEVEGEVNTYTDGNLILDLLGNVQIDNANPQIMIPDPNASIQGAIEIHYNKNERHFIGYAGVVLKTDALCASGSLLVDVKPGQWRVALGSREDRISLAPACTGIAYYGWLDLNSEYVEIGAGIGLVFYKEFGGINVGVAKLSLIVDAGVNANLFASVNYKPLTVREIGIFVEMWARVLVAYKIIAKKGTVELVDIYLYASSIMRFYPSPTLLYGTLKGHIRLIKIINFDFKKDYELEI